MVKGHKILKIITCFKETLCIFFVVFSPNFLLAKMQYFNTREFLSARIQYGDSALWTKYILRSVARAGSQKRIYINIYLFLRPRDSVKVQEMKNLLGGIKVKWMNKMERVFPRSRKPVLEGRESAQHIFFTRHFGSTEMGVSRIQFITLQYTLG